MDERLLQIARCDTIADVKECMKVLLGLYVRFNKVLVTKKNVSARMQKEHHFCSCLMVFRLWKKGRK